MSLAEWSMRKTRLRISADGSSELIERWHGPAGSSKVDRNTWLAQFNNWHSVEFDEDFVTDSGDAVCLADLSFKVDANGNKIAPGADDYGLIKRSWRLYGTAEQIPIEATTRVQALSQRGYASGSGDWPRVIAATVESWKKTVQTELDEWASGYDPASPTPPVLTPWPGADLWAPTGATPEEREWAAVYASLLAREDTPLAPATQYALAKVEEVTALSTIAVSHTYVGRWLSQGTLLAQEPTLAGSVSTRMAIASIQNALGELIWFKMAPEHIDSSGGNVELTQEYYASVRPAAGSLAEAVLELATGGPII